MPSFIAAGVTCMTYFREGAFLSPTIREQPPERPVSNRIKVLLKLGTLICETVGVLHCSANLEQKPNQ